MQLRRLYEYVPPRMQDIVVSGAGYHKNLTRFGATYSAHRRWLFDFDRAPYEAKRAVQDEFLRRFILSAHRQSKYYSDTLPVSAVDGFRGVEDLARLPILTKDDLRLRFDDISTVSARKGVVSRTGGSTGTPLVVHYTVSDNQVRMALIDHFKARVGFENRIDRRASFTAQSAVPRSNAGGRYSRYNRATNQLLFSAHHINPRNLDGIVAEINRFKPSGIDGFFSSIVEVAAYISATGARLEFCPAGIFPTSEALTADGRASIEEAFGAKVYDQYASSEGAPFITECIMGTRHVEHSSGVFESDPKTGGLLVTSFFTSGTPLIRYRIGDRIEVDSGFDCACGISSDVVTALEGKGQDFVLLADGTKVFQSHFTPFTRAMPPQVVRVQIVQSRLGQLDLKFQVPLEFDPSSLKSSLEELRNLCGNDMIYKVHLVERIERLPSGKVQLISNSLAGD